MPSASDAPGNGRRRRIIRRILKLAAFVLIFVLLNALCSFALEYTWSLSEQMWHDYFEQSGLDTIFIGASDCQRAISPTLVDEAAGYDSFNMATRAQTLELTCDALKTAVRDHHPERVVLALGYFSFEEDQNINAEAVFLQAKKEYSSFGERLRTDMEFMFDPRHLTDVSSLNYCVPWIYNNVGLSPADISYNIKTKLGNTGGGSRYDLYAEPAGYSPDVREGYGGRGYWYNNYTVDYFDYAGRTTAASYSGVVSGNKLDALRRIAVLCRENDVQLTVIAVPHPVFDVLSCGEAYFERMDMLSAFLEEYNAEYYDFNLVKPEIFESRENYFSDFEHMNYEGSSEFSRALGGFFARRDGGEDVRQYFYSPEEYLASIDYISAVSVSLEQTGGGVLIRSTAFTGSDVEPEFEMRLVNAETGETEIIREYGSSPEFIWTPDAAGTYTVRVCARITGTDVPFDRYKDESISVY